MADEITTAISKMEIDQKTSKMEMVINSVCKERDNPFLAAMPTSAPAGKKVHRLSFNENLYGPPPMVIEELKTYIRDLEFYPDPHISEVKKMLADYTGRSEKEIICASGASEVLFCINLVLNGDSIVFETPGFDVFPCHAEALGKKVHKVPMLDSPFRSNIDGVIQTIRNTKSRIAGLMRPHNPVGTMISEEDILRVLQEDCILVLDEAYIEFSEQKSMVHLLDSYPNLIICRTMSKWAAIAGMRLGYAIANPYIIDRMFEAKIKFTVSCITIRTACLSLKYKEEAFKNVEKIKAERLNLYALLRSNFFYPELSPILSETNFLYCTTGNLNATDVFSGLLTHSVRVKVEKSRIKADLRISIGLPEDSVALTKALVALYPPESNAGKWIVAKAPSAIAFDLDGVIADVTDTYHAAIKQLLEGYCKDKTVCDAVVGTSLLKTSKPYDQIAADLIESITGTQVQAGDISKKLESLYDTVKQNEKLLIAIEVLEKLHEKFHLILLTQRQMNDTKDFLDKFDIGKLFKIVMASENGNTESQLSQAKTMFSTQTTWLPFITSAIDSAKFDCSSSAEVEFPVVAKLAIIPANFKKYKAQAEQFIDSMYDSNAIAVAESLNGLDFLLTEV